MGDTPPVYCKGLAVDFFARFFFNAANTAKSLYQKIGLQNTNEIRLSYI